MVDAHRIEMKADASNGNRFSLCQVSGSDHSAGTHVAADYRASSAPEF
ncbi:hypothetical protein [Methylobacterium radiotolerans]|nr:hypothetical protein [Methylobacterium radiotolerans]UIY45591.1 hypothetical protein LZ599_31330 [Methylobacterium radiotolerans]